MTALRGSCLCGGVRFEIAGPLMRSSHCLCRQCQKGHGAPFRTRAWVATADFRFLASMPGRSTASRWLGSTMTPASAPTHTRLSSTTRRGSRSPTTFPNTQRVSPARTHDTIPDRPDHRGPDSPSRRGRPKSQTSMKKVPAAELSARSRFSQRTFAGAHGNGRDAPISDLPSLTPERGRSTHLRPSSPRQRLVVSLKKRSFAADFWSCWQTSSRQFV